MLNRILHKKLRASTLVEALVASVIIILIFAIASMTLNNVFQSSIHGNHSIDTHLNKLMYLYEQDKIGNDYQENFKEYEITISKLIENDQNYVKIEAVKSKQLNTKNSKKKIITKKMIDASSE